MKGNPQARGDRIVCSEKNDVIHQIWQKPQIFPGLSYLTPLCANQELHNNLSLKNEKGELNTSFFFPVDIKGTGGN